MNPKITFEVFPVQDGDTGHVISYYDVKQGRSVPLYMNVRVLVDGKRILQGWCGNTHHEIESEKDSCLKSLRRYVENNPSEFECPEWLIAFSDYEHVCR